MTNDDGLRALCEEELLLSMEPPLNKRNSKRDIAKGCLSLLAERDKLKEEVERLKERPWAGPSFETAFANQRARIQELEAQHKDLERVADDCQARNTQLKAQLQAAREALEPFKELWEKERARHGNAINDDWVFWDMDGVIVHLSDLRRAKAVFEDKDYGI